MAAYDCELGESIKDFYDSQRLRKIRSPAMLRDADLRGHVMIHEGMGNKMMVGMQEGEEGGGYDGLVELW